MQGSNPFLPENEYIPDGEPHVFGDRLYLFGSHDQEGGSTFCMLDYVVYSAPVSDITDWRCDGTIYRAEQDPDYARGRKYLYAPDVVKGNDGRYYLYYAMSGDKGTSGFDGPFRVAVCDEPAGEYQYYGYVKNPDDSVFRRMIPFDPGVINDDGIIRLYYGWSLPVNGFRFKPLQMILRQVMQKMFNKTKREIMAEPQGIMGANTVTLAEDMLTVTSEPKRIIPGQMDAKGTEFEGHAFFEASSIRKIADTYYFIYSSQKNHELCYATSKHPDKNFHYGGTIISAGDVGFNGRAEKERLNMTSNKHGSIECVQGQWYVFYHRHTHKHSYSRQACAEPVFISEDGSIKQVELTTSGLIGEPLAAKGKYPATIACVLTTGHMPHIVNGATRNKRIPFITHEGDIRYIANIRDGTLIGYRYFSFEGRTTISVMARGNMHGKLYIKTEMETSPVGSIDVHPAATWQRFSQTIDIRDDSAPLYLAYMGTGSLDLLRIDFQSYSILTKGDIGLKKRLLVLTDISRGIENDDIASLARLLLYSNEIDIEGLIAVTSCWAKRAGTQREKAIILKTIDAYSKVKDNLAVHQSGFPEADDLREITCCGIAKYGKYPSDGFCEYKWNDNEGVNRIINAVDKKDDRPVWIALWGGANTLAHAIWKVKTTRTKEELDKFLSKIRVYAISDQDAAGHWLRREFGSQLFYVVSPSPAKGSKYYCHATWPGISADNATHGSENGFRNKGFSGADKNLISKKWLKSNIRSHGKYGTIYPLPRFIMEGDTPSFLGLIPNGLNDMENPNYGGWGGRYECYIPKSDYTGTDETYPIWTNANDTLVGADGKTHCSPQASIWRWREDFQHDFAARMDWTITPHYEKANHPPIAVLAHGNTLHAKGGEQVLLRATGSYDPDGDSLTYKWLFYREAGNYFGELNIENHTSCNARFIAPKTNDILHIHIILIVKDNGKPSLSRYQRVIIQVDP